MVGMRLKLLLDNHSAEIKFIIKGNPNMKSLYVTERSKFETNKPKKNPKCSITLCQETGPRSNDELVTK